jgi:hypothetical protein
VAFETGPIEGRFITKAEASGCWFPDDPARKAERIAKQERL